MLRSTPFFTGLALLALLSTSPVLADIDGRLEFETRCAVCHGAGGFGDGPIAQYINLPMPNLTSLSQTHGGTFPEEQVRKVIDGREVIDGHGPIAMPVWGNEYNKQAVTFYGRFFDDYDAEAYIKERIDALVEHLKGLQQE